MNNLPDEAYIVLATGLITTITTILTQVFVARAESKKAARQETWEAQKRQSEWQSKQLEIKSLKLAELWLAVNLAKERLSDAGIQSKVGDQILPPPAKDLAASATSAAYGIALMYFPEMRPFVYALHVETAKLEAALWFHRLEDEKAASDRLPTVSTELADAIEKTARGLQQS